MLHSEIHEVCPKITELDLSRNLFESLHEVAAICDQLEHIKILRLDGNRFQDVTISPTQKDHFKLIFAKVQNLTLDSTLLSWKDIVDICSCFPALKSLSISGNEFDKLDDSITLETFPAISTIKLETNSFTSLSDLMPLSRITKLRQIVLKYSNV